MSRQRKAPSRVDELLGDLLSECPNSDDILGESGLLKELSYHLAASASNEGPANAHW